MCCCPPKRVVNIPGSLVAAHRRVAAISNESPKKLHHVLGFVARYVEVVDDNDFSLCEFRTQHAFRGNPEHPPVTTLAPVLNLGMVIIMIMKLMYLVSLASTRAGALEIQIKSLNLSWDGTTWTSTCTSRQRRTPLYPGPDRVRERAFPRGVRAPRAHARHSRADLRPQLPV